MRALTFAVIASLRMEAVRRFLFLLEVFLPRLWRWELWKIFTLPVPVTENLLAEARCVLTFPIWFFLLSYNKLDITARAPRVISWKRPGGESSSRTLNHEQQSYARRSHRQAIHDAAIDRQYAVSHRQTAHPASIEPTKCTTAPWAHRLLLSLIGQGIDDHTHEASFQDRLLVTASHLLRIHKELFQ